jgi:hypothetical protein
MTRTRAAWLGTKKFPLGPSIINSGCGKPLSPLFRVSRPKKYVKVVAAKKTEAAELCTAAPATAKSMT